MGNYELYYTEKYASGEYMEGRSSGEVYEKEGYDLINDFIIKHQIREKKAKCLEIGSGRGDFQDLVDDYTGLDYSKSVSEYYHKPFISGSAMELPFEDNSFEYIWSYATWEHIPDPELAFREAMRVLKKGGTFLLRPAWHCRPWAAEGYQVRPYSDFAIGGKIYKFFIPVFNFLPFRVFKMFFIRLVYLIIFSFNKNRKMPYKKLKANYEIFWQSDSDACNDLDPFLMMLWIKNNGYSIISHPNFLKQFFSRNEAIEIQKEK